VIDNKRIRPSPSSPPHLTRNIRFHAKTHLDSVCLPRHLNLFVVTQTQICTGYHVWNVNLRQLYISRSTTYALTSNHTRFTFVIYAKLSAQHIAGNKQQTKRTPLHTRYNNTLPPFPCFSQRLDPIQRSDHALLSLLFSYIIIVHPTFT
jgi:hypothetical protein